MIHCLTQKCVQMIVIVSDTLQGMLLSMSFAKNEIAAVD